MSLYIGKDINNKSVVHATSTERSETELREGITESTFFHSELPILTLEDALEPDHVHTLNTSAGVFTAVYVNQDDSLKNKFFINKANNSIVFPYVLGGVLYSGPPSNRTALFFNGYSATAVTVNSTQFLTTVDGSNTHYFTPNYILPGDIEFEMYSINTGTNNIVKPTGYDEENNEIVVNREGFVLRGVDISKLKFLSLKEVNSTDPSIVQGGGYIQLVNYGVSTSTSLEISTDNLFEMKIDNKNVISKDLSQYTGSRSMRWDVPFRTTCEKASAFTESNFPDGTVLISTQVSHTGTDTICNSSGCWGISAYGNSYPRLLCLFKINDTNKLYFPLLSGYTCSPNLPLIEISSTNNQITMDVVQTNYTVLDSSFPTWYRLTHALNVFTFKHV